MTSGHWLFTADAIQHDQFAESEQNEHQTLSKARNICENLDCAILFERKVGPYFSSVV